MKNKIPDKIVKKAANGDVDAFEEIYRAYFGFAVNVARRVVNNNEDVEEVIQEVFMSVYRNLGSFRMESSLKTWIYRITVNCAVNYSKKASRHQARRVEFVEEIHYENRISDVEKKVSIRENKELIARLLEHLNPDQRACIVLRSMEGLSYSQIAQTLTIPVNTVRSRIKRGREALLNLRKEVMQNEM